MKGIKNEQGFTIVELMITIAIIGVLAAVAGVQFKTYQSKSRAAEAKIQLSAIYTSQNIFYNEFDFYSNCLSDMGFAPSGNAKRFYAIGFPNLTAAVGTAVYNQAVANGLVSGSCPANLGPILDQSYFLASNGAGSAVMNTLAEFQAAIIATNNSISRSGPITSRDVQEGLGSMLSSDTQVFTAAAAGYINTDGNTPTTSSLWSIDQDKVIVAVRAGY
jgi:prepilin-type N-terminal cleavage/methylation domain-containing protein